jgi:cob(I)alamin adenosyltransferase
MIHVYYGRGKGKTSAAFGAALRAAGQDLPVLVVQFMKDEASPSGEVISLARCRPAIEFLSAPLPYSIVKPPNRRALLLLKENTRKLLEEAGRHLADGTYRLIVLDELGVALSRGWLERAPVEALLDGLRPDREIIVTGRRMPRWLIERGDYVTRMTLVRHPYDRGTPARKGIEY